jgi:CBS domain containing-hemolysin-like protein
MAMLGRVPAVGDEVSVDGWTIRVDAMDGRRVDRLRFTPVKEGSGPADEKQSTDRRGGGESQ